MPPLGQLLWQGISVEHMPQQLNKMADHSEGMHEERELGVRKEAGVGNMIGFAIAAQEGFKKTVSCIIYIHI